MKGLGGFMVTALALGMMACDGGGHANLLPEGDSGGTDEATEDSGATDEETGDTGSDTGGGTFVEPPCAAAEAAVISIIGSYEATCDCEDLDPEDCAVYEQGLASDLKAMVGRALPSTTSGSNTGGVEYIEGVGGDALTKLRVLVEARYDQSGSLLDPQGSSMVSLKLQVERSESWHDLATDTFVADGLILADGETVGLEEEFSPQIESWFDTVHSTLMSELVPTSFDAVSTPTVLDVTGIVPEEGDWDVINVEDHFGSLEAESSGLDNFCFEVTQEILHFDYESTFEPQILGLAELWKEIDSGSPPEDPVEVHFPLVEFPGLCDSGLATDMCARPIVRHQVRLIYAYGQEVNRAVLPPETNDTTVLCPRKVEPPRPEGVLGFLPGESQDLEFIFTGLDDLPIEGLEVTRISLDNPDFGTIEPQVGEGLDPAIPTDSNGKITATVTAHEDVPYGTTALVEVEACQDVDEELLGKDASGAPLYWAGLTSHQLVGYGSMPLIQVKTETHHTAYEFWLDETRTSANAYDHTSEQFSSDVRIGLSFSVLFSSRTVEEADDAESGFKGRVVRYQGTTQGAIDISNPVTIDWTIDEDGWWNSAACGKQDYAYRSMEWEQRVLVNNATPNLVVYYQHFVPDEDSVVTAHPLEGLSFFQANPLAANVAYRHTKVQREMVTDGCAVSYESQTVPIPQVPININHSFPLLALQYADYCYGFETSYDQVTANDQRATLRTLNEDATAFDALHISQTVSLTEQDTAECWDYASSATTVYDGAVSGTFTWDYTAEILDGFFDLDPNTH